MKRTPVVYGGVRGKWKDGATPPGLVVCHQRPGTAKSFVFLVVEDEFGLVNVIVKPYLYERERSLVRTEPFVIVRGELQRRDGTVNLLAESIRVLQKADSLEPQARNFG